MTYDLTRLAQLGKRRKRLLDQLEDLRRELTPEILAAHHAGVEQKTIVEATHYTRDWVRQLCMSPAQREAARNRRRKQT